MTRLETCKDRVRRIMARAMLDTRLAVRARRLVRRLARTAFHDGRSRTFEVLDALEEALGYAVDWHLSGKLDESLAAARAMTLVTFEQLETGPLFVLPSPAHAELH